MGHGARSGQAAQDRILVARIMGAAGARAAARPVDLETSAAEVREIAEGRPDLLASAAGTYLGIAQVDAYHWYYPLAAQICLDAGADREAVPWAVEQARNRADKSWSGITAPDTSVRPR